eukprot:5152382-Alexandrium_andersonii.AAC.1
MRSQGPPGRHTWAGALRVSTKRSGFLPARALCAVAAASWSVSVATNSRWPAILAYFDLFSGDPVRP